MRHLIMALGIALSAVMAALPVAAEDNPIVVPPQSRPFDATYGDWSARWWQWVYQTPVGHNPEFNPDKGTLAKPATVDCSAGQRGPVWFLGGTFLPTQTSPGTFEDTVYRKCTIPSETFLFFPILNAEFDNLGCPNTSYRAAELKRGTKFVIDDVVSSSVSATIDGASVSRLASAHSRYRASSPWFSYRLPADNIGPIVGATSPLAQRHHRQRTVLTSQELPPMAST
jgi:hypothetical protein